MSDPTDVDSARRFPWPVDVFQLSTVLLPGGVLLLLLPRGVENGFLETFLRQMLRSEVGWLRYPATVVMVLLAGYAINVAGHLARLGIWFSRAQAAVDEVQQLKSLDEAFLVTVELAAGESGDKPFSAKRLRAARESLVAHAALIPRGKAFRHTTRALDLETNLAVATACLGLVHCYRGSILGAGMAASFAVGLGLSAWLRGSAWWLQLILLLAGVDLHELHRARREEAENVARTSKKVFEERVLKRTEQLQARIDELEALRQSDAAELLRARQHGQQQEAESTALRERLAKSDKDMTQLSRDLEQARRQIMARETKWDLPPKSQWKATASRSYAAEPPEGPIKEPPVRWATGDKQAGDEWYQIDFGKVVDIQRVMMSRNTKSKNDFPRKYEVIVSNESVDLSAAPKVVGTGEIGKPEEIHFSPPARGRYLLIKQTGSDGTEWWWSIDSVEIG